MDLGGVRRRLVRPRAASSARPTGEESPPPNLAGLRRQELPPYVIFHDATLIEVTRRRPGTLEALADIPGIGHSKLDRYGAAVLAITANGA